MTMENSDGREGCYPIREWLVRNVQFKDADVMYGFNHNQTSVNFLQLLMDDWLCVTPQFLWNSDVTGADKVPISCLSYHELTDASSACLSCF